MSAGAVPELDMRRHIVGEIKRITASQGGQVPGVAVFERETGIKVHEWHGKFWAKWGDAVAEAGFASNEFNKAFSDEFVLTAFAQAVRALGKVPTKGELKLFRRDVDGFPNDKVILERFGNKSGLLRRFKAFCEQVSEHSELLKYLENDAAEELAQTESETEVGFVYLLQSGAHYKIGRGEDIERRVKQISVALPDATKLIHAIRTDDPSGIEAYWHRRFADRRANGEWFRLTAKDLAAFKRRKFQ